MEGNEKCCISLNAGSDDCRINCTDCESLRSILAITLDQISELADSCNSTDHHEIISYFSNSFKHAVEENAVLNGLPLSLEENSKSTLPEEGDDRQRVDDALFSKLSKTISNVAHKRKFCPEHCSRILNIEMKHDLQNLKKAKVVSSSVSSIPCIISSSQDINCIKKFSEFCKNFNIIQENVQYEEQQWKKLQMEINLALDIKKKQKLH